MITIKGKEYQLKYTLRGLFVYEHITGVPFSPDKSLNVYVLIYCFLLVSNEGFNMTFEEFTDSLDEDPKTVVTIMKWMEDETKRMNLLSGEITESENKKKV